VVGCPAAAAGTHGESGPCRGVIDMELHADAGAGALEPSDRLADPAFVYAISLLAIDPNG
jgi:hypothetical protein